MIVWGKNCYHLQFLKPSYWFFPGYQDMMHQLPRILINNALGLVDNSGTKVKLETLRDELVLASSFSKKDNEGSKSVKNKSGKSTQGGTLSKKKGDMPSAKSEEEKPLIRLEEFDEPMRRILELNKQMVQIVQEVVDSLEGRRGDSPEENKAIATRLRMLAQISGSQLTTQDGHSIYYQWNQGIFRALTTGQEREEIDSKATSLPLNVRSKSETIKRDESLTNWINKINPSNKQQHSPRSR